MTGFPLTIRVLEEIPDDCKAHIDQLKDNWNGLQKIAAEINEFKGKLREPIAIHRKAFETALNNTITELMEIGYVQSINQALMAICSDEMIQNNCINFPKSPRGLRNYIDEENVKQLLHRRPDKDRTKLQNTNLQEIESLQIHPLEQSSAAVYKDKTVTSDLEHFRAKGFHDIRPYNVWNFDEDEDYMMGLKHQDQGKDELEHEREHDKKDIADYTLDQIDSVTDIEIAKAGWKYQLILAAFFEEKWMKEENQE